jgi:hypothetical protein
MSDQRTPTTTAAARRVPCLRLPGLLPVVFRAEWAKTGRPGREGWASRTLLAFWLGAPALPLLLAAVGVLVGEPGLTAYGIFCAVPLCALPVLTALAIPGWEAWADPEGKAVILTDPTGDLSGFWAVGGDAQALAVAVAGKMLDRHGRAGYRPRSERHARAYAAAVTRSIPGATAAPRDKDKPRRWWDITRDR